MPRRIQRRRVRGWRLPEGAIYVGRPTIFGNPFVVGPYAFSREEAIANFRTWLLDGKPHGFYEDQRFELKVALARGDLRGHDLACWCPIEDDEGKPVACHADILLAIANGVEEFHG